MPNGVIAYSYSFQTLFTSAGIWRVNFNINKGRFIKCKHFLWGKESRKKIIFFSGQSTKRREWGEYRGFPLRKNNFFSNVYFSSKKPFF